MPKPAPRRLLAIDPGLPDCGAALYEHGTLIKAVWARVKHQRDVSCPACHPRLCDHGAKPAALTALCDRVEADLGLTDLPLRHPDLPQVVVVEWPQVFYPGKQQGALPLFFLAALSASLLDRASAWGAAGYYYLPHRWKGIQRKAVHQARGLTMLEAGERALLPKNTKGVYRSDPLDAALLGLWWLSACSLRTLTASGTYQRFLPLVEKDAPKKASKS